MLNNYLHIQHISEKHFDKDKGLVEKEYDVSIFPRFHQLDCVRCILDAVRKEGVGYSYLVQHSAGSGKSNSIAWLAHQLASLYRQKTDKDRLFDSIIVVTDRRILDRQLQNTIKQFEQTTGVVNPIDLNSAQLRDALQTGKAIVISTIQKFGVIADTMSGLKGNRFAVIIDEAHSSASGQEARDLRKTLSVQGVEEDEEVEVDIEDEIEKEIKARGRQPHISYFAFTATPKNKTLELFGRKNDVGKPIPFHVYSMRQAIEENFILDVLKNYTTFKRYFKLLKTVEDDKEYDKKKATRLLTSFVDMQPHTLEMKTRIILEHFLAKTVNSIQGRGRAMVVTRSRLYAVKLYQMFRKIMAEKNLPFKALVAFSGKVKDPDAPEEYTENGLNRLKARVSIEDAFKTPEYRILIVANKFQTGFDEPLLQTMYVDKKLDGLNAVQCLSRLNRTMPGKTEAVILDFVNEADDIQESFQPYYQTTILKEETDPNKLYDLQTEIDGCEVFKKDDVEAFAEIFYNRNEAMEKLQPILDRVVAVWKAKPEDEREDFRALLQSYIRLYGFVSQLITFVDTGLEKLYVFSKALNRKLKRKVTTLPVEVQDAVDLDSLRLQETFSGSKSLRKEDGEVYPIGDGKHKMVKEDRDLLSRIIETLNETCGAELTEEDKVDLEHIRGKVESDEGLIAVRNPDNSPENIRIKFEEVVDSVLLDFVHTKLELYKKMTDPKVNELFKRKWFEALKENTA